MPYPIRFAPVALVAVLLAFAATNPHPATAQEDECSSYGLAYDHGNKKIARVENETFVGLYDDETATQLKILNERIKQMITLTLMEHHGCELPKDRSDEDIYHKEAFTCAMAIFKSERNSVELCEMENWIGEEW